MTVALGVVLGPAPEVLAGLLEGTLGFPTKLLVGASRVGGEVENVTGAAGGNLIRKVTANGSGEGANHLVDGAALAGTQVPGADAGVVGTQVVEGLEVTIGEIENMDVVTDSGSVVGGIVLSLR